MTTGSSPLARGTREGPRSSYHRPRFIPADAGNTPSCWAPWRLSTVHPRWRGEQLIPHVYSGPRIGSSPLARGTECQCHRPVQPARFIPAGAGNRRPPNLATAARGFIPTGAGNSPSGQPGPVIVPVHPRWRGEQPCLVSLQAVDVGSSPLARGTAACNKLVLIEPRFIPAGAGNRLAAFLNLT